MQRSCRNPIVFSTFSYYWGPCSEAAGNLCVSTFSYWGSSSEAARHPLFSYCFLLLLGVKQRSCETPIVFLLFPIIGGLAARLRSTHCVSSFLGVKQRSCETPIVFVRFPIIGAFCPIISKLGTYVHQTMPHKSYRTDFSNSKAFGRNSQSKSTTKPPNRKQANFSETL